MANGNGIKMDMITSGDVQDMIVGMLKERFTDIDVRPQENNIDYDYSESRSNRIVVQSHKQTVEKQWVKNFVNIYIVVADEGKEAKTGTLKAYQRRLQDMFYGGIVTEFNGAICHITYSESSIEDDKALKSHYVNCRLLVKILK